MQATDTVHKFLRRIASNESREVSLVLVGPRDQSSVVNTFEVVGDSDDSELLQLADSIIEYAQEDADGIGSLQRYVVTFDGEGQTVRSPAFRIRPNATKDAQVFESEPADANGLLAMLMRHLEVTTRALVTSQTAQLDYQNRTLARQAETIESMHKDKLKTISLVEDLHSRQQERLLAAKESESRIKQKDELLAAVKPLVTVVGGKLLGGGKLSPEVQGPALKSFFDSLTKEQVQAITDSLTPVQQAALIEIVAGAGEEKVH